MLQSLSQNLLHRLRRVTSGGEYQAEIDGVRFVAIVLVLIHHTHEAVIRQTQALYPHITESLLAIGGPGVNLFFALSGFLLYRGLRLSLERYGKVRVKPYFIRRITRLEPPYLLVMTGIFLYLLANGYRNPALQQTTANPGDLLAAWGASMTYTYCFFFGHLPRINPVAWSLETEVQFYILAPLMALAIVRLPSRLRTWAVGLVAVVWAATIGSWAATLEHVRFSLAVFLPFFLMGIVVEEMIVNSQKKNSLKLTYTADIVGLVALILVLALPGPNYDPAVAVGRVLLTLATLWGMLYGRAFRSFLSIPWVSVIGGMCYTIYLIHVPLYELTIKLTQSWGAGLSYPAYFLLQGLILNVLLFAASIVFYLLIERPCMNKNWPRDLMTFLRQRFSRRSASADVTSTSLASGNSYSRTAVNTAQNQ